MPQLAIETFFSQYFWLVVVLFAFYYYLMISFIPQISNILKTRSKLSEDLTPDLLTSQEDTTSIPKNIASQFAPLVNPFKGQIKSWTKSKSTKVKSAKSSSKKSTLTDKSKILPKIKIAKLPKLSKVGKIKISTSKLASPIISKIAKTPVIPVVKPNKSEGKKGKKK